MTLIAAHPQNIPAMRRTKPAPCDVCDAAPILHTALPAHASAGLARATLRTTCSPVPAHTCRPNWHPTGSPRHPTGPPRQAAAAHARLYLLLEPQLTILYTLPSCTDPRTHSLSASVNGGRTPCLPMGNHGAHNVVIKCALSAPSPPACSPDARSPKILAQLQVQLAELP